MDAKIQRVLSTARKQGAITSIKDDVVEVRLSNGDETAVIKMALDKEDSTAEHLSELIQWQVDSWQ